MWATWWRCCPWPPPNSTAPHLPVSVDTTLVNGVIEASLPHLGADLPVLFLPTQQVGKSNEHLRFPGTLTLSVETLIRVWMELGECVARAGIKKLGAVQLARAGR